MRYHYEKPKHYTSAFAFSHRCDHPVYDKCTLFKIGRKGLAVIQQRHDPKTKKSWWGEIDPWLIGELYLHMKFKKFFDERAGEPVEGIYPTVSIRQIMWALKIKPIPRERWETSFDRRDI